MGESVHFVQFYDDDEFLVEAVSGFAAAALTAGQVGLVIATAEHRRTLEEKLAAEGIDVAEAVASERLVLLDAAETLAGFLVDGVPDRGRFNATVGETIARMARGGHQIHAFGEMVAMLWVEGNRDGAIRLEEMWNELRNQHRFALFCAYPMTGFGDRDDEAALAGVCGAHDRVMPSEHYAAIDNDDARRRAIAQFQTKSAVAGIGDCPPPRGRKVACPAGAQLADFVENATVGLHKMGPDGTILWANKAECDLLGYSLDEVVGRSAAEFHADAGAIAELLDKVRAGEAVENFPARLRCKNGRVKHVLISSNACFEGGEFAYTRCFTRDMTRQVQAENALREADRRKDEFLATLAHELRNPLAPVKNALELLKVAGRNAQVVEEARDDHGAPSRANGPAGRRLARRESDHAGSKSSCARSAWRWRRC